MHMLLAIAFAAATTVQGGPEHHECPMMQAGQRQAEVSHRHQRATGVLSDGTEHHFLIRPSGGSIRLEAKDAADARTRDGVREHLRTIARSFAEGDFTTPVHVHDQVPPGVEVMKARPSTIRYAFRETPRGGEVTIATEDQESLAAVHAFLRFQIRDHGTGDPTE